MAERRTAGDSRRRRTRDRGESLKEVEKAPIQGYTPIPPPQRSRVGREEQTSRMGRRKGQTFEQSKTNAVDGTRSGKSSLGVTDFEEGKEQTRPLGDAEKGVDRSPGFYPHKTPLEHTSEDIVLALLSQNNLQDASKQPNNIEEKKQAGLRRRAALVEGIIKLSSNKELVKYFKNGATRALKEIHCLRSKLDRAEAAVEGGRLAQNLAVTELQEKLDECRQIIHEMEKEAQQHRIQHKKSKVEEARLREELKKAQEALSFLSEWDEEKGELEAEVARLTKKVSSAVEEGKEHVEEAHRAFLNSSAAEVYKMQKQIIKDREIIRQELERGLSEEFQNRKRENEELRREREHHNQEMNWILKELMKAKAARYVRRTELEDERHMHLMTIRKQKISEAMIAKLKARLTDAMSSKLCQPEHPQTSAYPGALSTLASSNVPHTTIQRSPQPAHNTGRGIFRDGSHRAGSSGGAEMSDELAFGQCRGTASQIGSSNSIYGNSSRNSQAASLDRSEVTEPLMPAWSEGTNIFDSGKTSTVERDTGNVSTRGGRKRRRSYADVVEGDVTCRGNECSDVSSKIGTGGHRTQENSSSETATPGDKSGRGDEEEGEVSEALPRTVSEVTSTDVWSQLDSYVHRRQAEVARAKRHVRVIDAMCKHLPKSTSHIGDTTKRSHRSNTTIRHAGKKVQVQGRVDRSTKKYDVTWRASQIRQTRRRASSNDSTLVNKFSSPVKERSIISDSEERFSGSVLPSGTSSKPRTHLKPHPPRRVRRALQLDGSVSSLSQGTTLGTLSTIDEKEQDPDRTVVTLGMTPVHTVDPNNIQVEDADRSTPKVITRLPDYTAKGTDCSGGDHASLGKVLHKPYSGWYHGVDSINNSLCSNDDLNTGPGIGGSRSPRLLLGSTMRMTTNCVTRAPGAVGTLNDGGNAWVNKTMDKTPPEWKKREDGDIHANSRPTGRVWRIGGRSRGGKLGANRRNCRNLELAG